MPEKKTKKFVTVVLEILNRRRKPQKKEDNEAGKRDQMTGIIQKTSDLQEDQERRHFGFKQLILANGAS